MRGATSAGSDGLVDGGRMRVRRCARDGEKAKEDATAHDVAGAFEGDDDEGYRNSMLKYLIDRKSALYPELLDMTMGEFLERHKRAPRAEKSGTVRDGAHGGETRQAASPV